MAKGSPRWRWSNRTDALGMPRFIASSWLRDDPSSPLLVVGDVVRGPLVWPGAVDGRRNGRERGMGPERMEATYRREFIPTVRTSKKRREDDAVAGGFAAAVRSGAPPLWRRLPSRMRPEVRSLARFNEAMRALGAPPLAVTAMRAGHRLQLDLRSGTEWLSYYTGEFDDGQLAAACHLLHRPGAVAVDAGANIGFWTVPLARAAAAVDGRVVAVEPVPNNRTRLSTNLRLNCLAEVTDMCPVAASDQPQQLVITLREDFVDGAATGNAAVRIDDGTDDRFDQITVEARPVDDLLEGLDVPRVDVVKSDVEGHEDRLLSGAMRTFQRWRPVAFFEWNRIYYQRRRVDPVSTVGRLLDTLDYRCLRRQGPGWVETAAFSSPREMDDLVLVPAERTTHVRGLLEECTGAARRAWPSRR